MAESTASITNLNLLQISDQASDIFSVDNQALLYQNIVSNQSAHYFAEQKRAAMKLIKISQSMKNLSEFNKKGGKCNSMVLTHARQDENVRVARGSKRSTVKLISKNKLSKELHGVL